MTADWHIERMQFDRDIEEVLTIARDSFTQPWTRDMFEWEAEHSDVSVCLVLRHSDALVAFCTAWVVSDEAHINNLAVRPDCRRQGAAVRLLEAMLTAAAARGAGRATLEVRPSNAAARQLYEKLGFLVAGRRPGYYRFPQEDALILWREDLDVFKPASSAAP